MRRRIAPVVVNRQLTEELLAQLGGSFAPDAENAQSQCWSADHSRCYALVPGELLEIDASKQIVLRTLPLGSEPGLAPARRITWTSQGLLVARLTEAFLIDPESMSVTCQFELRGAHWLAGCQASPLVAVAFHTENLGVLRVDRLELVAALDSVSLQETIAKATGEKVKATFAELTMTEDGKHVILKADQSGRQQRLSIGAEGISWERP